MIVYKIASRQITDGALALNLVRADGTLVGQHIVITSCYIGAPKTYANAKEYEKYSDTLCQA
jgi:hypothetical protein